MKTIKYLFFALRPKQWVKNFFIILPAVFGRKLFVFPESLQVFWAAFLFSLVSGVVYLMNDLLDLQKDRRHSEKRLRPLASGKITPDQAKITILLLGFFSLILSFRLDVSFGWIVAAYLIFNLVYTLLLKEVVIIDVFCIGVFFLLRIIAGSTVAKVDMSYWIVFMSVLLALFLGFNKRRHELAFLKNKASLHRSVLTRYNVYFIDQMIAVITSSIVVAYMLYTVDEATVGRFGTNHLILSIPFVYYGIFRYLYLVHKRGKGGDPTRVLLSDRMIQLNIAFWLAACIAVIYFGL